MIEGYKSNIKIQKTLFVLIYLSELRFFSIPGLSGLLAGVCNYNIKVLTLLFVFFAFLLMLRENQFRLNIYRNESMLVFFLLIIGITFLISTIVYNQTSIIKILWQYHYYLLFLYLFVLIDTAYKNDTFVEYCVTVVIVLSTIYAIYAIATKATCDFSGIQLMDSTTQLYSKRDGTRLGQTADYVLIGALLSVFRIMKVQDKRNKRNYILAFSVCTVELFYVAQARSYELFLVITIIIAVLFGTKGQLKKIFLIILILSSVFLLNESIAEYINSFSEYTYSTENRIGAIQYYITCIFDLGVIGIGFPSTTYQSIIRGPALSFSLTDCGYIGFFATFGFLGMVFIILLLEGMLRKLWKYRYMECTYQKVAIFGITTFFVVSNFSLCFSDPQRCVVSMILILFLLYNCPENNFPKKGEL